MYIHRAFYTLASSTSTWVISFLALGYIKYSVSFINKKDPTWNCFSARTFFRFSFFSLAIILSPHRPFSLVSDGKWWENKRRPLLTAPVRTRRKPRKKICGPFSFHGRHNWGDGIFFQPKKEGFESNLVDFISIVGRMVERLLLEELWTPSWEQQPSRAYSISTACD